MSDADAGRASTPGGNPHVVLAASDVERFARCARPRPGGRERYKLGRALRQKVPRSALARWSEPAGRADPVQQVLAIHEGRLDRLIPVRVGPWGTSARRVPLRILSLRWPVVAVELRT